MSRFVAPTRSVNRRVHSSLPRLYKPSEESPTSHGQHLRDSRVLQFSEELYQSLPKRWHDVGRIVHGEASDQRDSGDSVLKNLIVYCNEEHTNVLCLSQMLVEAFV